MSDIYFFDLDGTLWQTNAKWWIIDKNNPQTYITRISQYDAQQIINGKYINENHSISYNGINGWLSSELLTKLRKKKFYDLNDLGLSFREYQDDKLILQQHENLFIYMDHINLKDKTINLLTARGNKLAHKKLLNILQTKLNEKGIIINDSIFVNDPKTFTHTGSSAIKKLIVLTEAIIGYKIKDNKFDSLVTTEYNKVYFYDDEDVNIDTAKEINDYIKTLIYNTEPWLQERIKNKIKNKKQLILNLVTTNKLNPFLTTIIDIIF